MKAMLPPDRTDRLLNKLPPFLDGYEAICIAIAQGRHDDAWALAKQLRASSEVLKRELLKTFDDRQQRAAKGRKRHESMAPSTRRISCGTGQTNVDKGESSTRGGGISVDVERHEKWRDRLDP